MDIPQQQIALTYARPEKKYLHLPIYSIKNPLGAKSEVNEWLRYYTCVMSHHSNLCAI